MSLVKTNIREAIEWTNMRWNNAPNNTLPRVLLIGDSIVLGHADRVHELLKDHCCIDYMATAKCVSDIDYREELAYILSKHNYAMILFNNGLHGWEIADKIYAANLQATMADLKKVTPTLAWRTSTPVRDKENLEKFRDDRNPRVIKRNHDAATFARELQLPILDLYTPMSERPDLFCADAIHYTEQGCQEQAKLVAAFIVEQLAF